MSLYVAREASKLWRRITTEFSMEIKLLMEKWKLLLAGLVCQYIHGVAARGVHYLHRPGPILQDVGFMLLPELGKDRAYISETLFSTIFLSFFLWTFHPFVFQSKRFYTVLIWRRILAFLVASQVLRIITFYSTQLPGPNYHCREGSELATLPPPNHIYEVLLLINFPRGVLYGCGDLIFSSHMIFTLVFVHTYQKYGSKRCIKQLAWLVAVIQSILIIASRKHYTVDIVVAWYTVSLVVFFVDSKLPEMLDRTIPSSLLPLTVKQKDGKSWEENLKPLSGNSIDSADRDFVTWKRIVIGLISNGLYRLPVSMALALPSVIIEKGQKKTVIQTWHERLGYINISILNKLFPSLCNSSSYKCEVCQMAKHAHIVYPKLENKCDFPFGLVHSDVWGPFNIKTMNDAQYFITFIDDWSRTTC